MEEAARQAQRRDSADGQWGSPVSLESKDRQGEGRVGCKGRLGPPQQGTGAVSELGSLSWKQGALC